MLVVYILSQVHNFRGYFVDGKNNQKIYFEMHNIAHITLLILHIYNTKNIICITSSSDILVDLLICEILYRGKMFTTLCAFAMMHSMFKILSKMGAHV